MAKLILTCRKDGRKDPLFHEKIQALSRRLSPDNITPHPPKFVEDSGAAMAIFNPSPHLPVHNASVCLGNMIRPPQDWWKPGTPAPEGSYALFRSDEKTVEIATDILASRTVWYAHTGNLFLASTSQRAIISFLQEFEPQKAVYPWMLSSGTLGPAFSWDSRIQCLPADSRLVLDRADWDLSIQRTPVQFHPLPMPDVEHENQVRETVARVFQNLDLDYSRWVLPLSGGRDSRAILLYLQDRKNLQCITWGLEESLDDKQNDAFIARSLAKRFHLEHLYFPIGLSGEPFPRLLDRFLAAGEGRSDNIAGYMDGFEIWKHLFRSGYHGILRGDQAFGNRSVSSTKDVYKNMGLITLTDFDNLEPIAPVIRQFNQERPSWLERNEEEGLEDWRERVSAEFEFPAIFAALNDIKLPYVEIVNPLLSHSIVRRIRRLPPPLRTDKTLFLRILKSMGPPIPFARHRAVALTTDYLDSPEAVEFIMDEVTSQHGRSLLPEELIRFIVQNMAAAEKPGKKKTSLARRTLRRMVPQNVRKWRKSRLLKRNLDLNLLGFRACLICRMTEILSEDARSLSHLPLQARKNG